MDMSGMAMGSMSMGGMAPLIEFPKYYWAVVGTAIGVATVVNVFNNILYRQRLAAARAGSAHPAKPKSFLMVSIATTFALTREASNFSVRIPFKNSFLLLPTIGRVSLILANIVVLLVLCFYGFDLNDRWSRENVGYRCGFVTIAQFPLIFLLAGKNNLIGYATGVSHERLNWLHRWCARCLLLTATIHMGYFFADWAPYNYIGTQLRENTLVWKGIVAWAVLVWMVFSSTSPIRGWSYEMFVLQHLVSFAILIGFVYIHTPVEVHVYIWVPVALWWFDRVFLVKARSGGTKHFFEHAEKFHGLPTTSDKPRTMTVAIEGPYGALRPLRQFDSVVLLAGSTGATFTVPLLRDILQGWKENTSPAKNSYSLFKAPKGAVTRYVRFVWVVKSRGQLGWFAQQLSSMYTDFQALQTSLRHIKLELTVYVTCDETFTEEHKNILSTITTSKQSKHGPVEIRSRSPSLDDKEKVDGAFDEITEEETMVAALEAFPISMSNEQLTNPHTQADDTLGSLSEPESTPQYTPKSTPEMKPSVSPATHSFDEIGQVVFMKLEDGFGSVAEQELNETVTGSGTKTAKSGMSGHASDLCEPIRNVVQSHTVRHRATSPKSNDYQPVREGMERVGGGMVEDNPLPADRLGPFEGGLYLVVILLCIALIYKVP
ncbi:ferric-chelate reductase Frp1 [Paraconiothyrium brasiliense]|uniref:Ferric-chelate reductase Frp1 n=1 Tax=Paraconiothyrium brasiliense TaxID=300254 RepID=A0ABR3RN70_9PLEO